MSYFENICDFVKMPYDYISSILGISILIFLLNGSFGLIAGMKRKIGYLKVFKYCSLSSIAFDALIIIFLIIFFSLGKIDSFVDSFYVAIGFYFFVLL